MKNIWNDKNWTPMLLKEIKKPFNSKNYIYELKFDGIRALIFANRKGIKIQSRNKLDITHLFPELQEIKKIVQKNTIFDGEIVSFENQKPSFNKIQERMHLKDKNKIKNYAQTNPVIFIVFDILYDNKEITSYSLSQRKKILDKYPDNEIFVKTKMYDNGINLFKNVQKLKLEGIVAKNKNSTYHINKRTDDFIKIKNTQRDTFLIGGYEYKKNNIISLSLGELKNKKLYFVGKISISPKNKLYEKILNQKITKNYFCEFKENINFINPTIKCEIKYLERTKNNHLRHPKFYN